MRRAGSWPGAWGSPAGFAPHTLSPPQPPPPPVCGGSTQTAARGPPETALFVFPAWTCQPRDVTAEAATPGASEGSGTRPSAVPAPLGSLLCPSLHPLQPWAPELPSSRPGQGSEGSPGAALPPWGLVLPHPGGGVLRGPRGRGRGGRDPPSHPTHTPVPHNPPTPGSEPPHTACTQSTWAPRPPFSLWPPALRR